jgi:hypothetical protein
MLCISVGLLRTAQFGNYFQITQIKESSLKDSVRREWTMSKEEKLELLSLPFRELVAKRVAIPVQMLKGADWDEFFAKAHKGFEQGQIPQEWQVGAEVLFSNIFTLWLPETTSPLNKVDKSLFSEPYADVPIASAANPNLIFRLRFYEIKADDYQSFNGFSVQTPPLAMFYPYRIPAILTAVAGLLLYLFIPWTKPIPDAVHTKRWQVMMIDLAALILFLPFFMLGSFMAGPIPLGVNGGWIISIVMWLLCIGGLYLFKQGVFYALFCMRSEDDGLRIRSFQGEFKLPYSDIEKVQGAVLKNPRWLVALLTLAALFGRGSQSALAGGQALMLGSSSYPGLGFTLKRGGTIYLWSSGQSEEMSTYRHIDKFKAGLEKAGVPLEEEPVVIYGLGTEPRFDQAVEMDAPFISRRPLSLLLLAPVVSTLLVYVIAPFI